MNIYPYLEDYSNVDGAELLKLVNAAVNTRLDENLRADICQELVLDILQKKIPKTKISLYVSQYVKKFMRRYTHNYDEIYLYQPVDEDESEGSLFDKLAAKDEPTDLLEGHEQNLPRQQRKNKGRQWNGEYLPCKQCQNPFYVTPHLYKRGRRFCSRSCAYQSRKDRTVQATYPSKNPCVGCGKYFVGHHPNQKGCSQKCRMDAFHRRVRTNRLCHYCAKPSLPDYAKACAEHAEYEKQVNSAHKKATRSMRKQLGLCIDCGLKPQLTFTTRCQGCRDNAIERKRAFRRTQKAVLL